MYPTINKKKLEVLLVSQKTLLFYLICLPKSDMIKIHAYYYNSTINSKKAALSQSKQHLQYIPVIALVGVM